MYNIQYHAIDGSDGGKLAEGFETVETAHQWAEQHVDLGEYDDSTVQIHEADSDTYGEAVEDLN